MLRSTRSESTYASWIRVSLVAAEESEVEENQVGWCALKSSKIKEPPWVWKSRSMEGEKPGGQEEGGVECRC